MRGLRLVAAVILLLALGVGGAILFQLQRVPVLLDGPDEAGPPPVNPRTAPAIECLRRELPRHFDDTESAQFNAAVKHCLGDDPVAIEMSGVGGFPLGTDPRTEQPVELGLVAAGDLGPSAWAVIRYTGNIRERECQCLGGAPIFGMSVKSFYAGCAPDGFSFFLDGFDGIDKRPFTWMPQEIGIPNHGIVIRADDRAVESRADVIRVLHRFPDDPPQTIVVRTDEGTRDIRYVSWGTIQRYSNLLAQLRRRFPHPPSCRRHASPVLTVAGVAIHPRCRDAQTRAWLRFARAIEVVPVGLLDARPGDQFPGCNARRAAATAFSVTKGAVTFEVRFVSWMAWGRGGARRARPSQRAPASSDSQ